MKTKRKKSNNSSSPGRQAVTVSPPAAELMSSELSDRQPDTNKPGARFRVLANANCYGVVEVVLAAEDRKHAETLARQILDSARFNITADTNGGPHLVTDLAQDNVDVEVLETNRLNGGMESKPKAGNSQVVVPGALSVVSTPPNCEQPFLVIILDESDDTACAIVVRAEYPEAAERKALDERKAEHDLTHLDDQAAGFRVLATYDRECMEYFRRQMEFPEPDV